MEKIISEREYRELLRQNNEKHIIKQDILMFQNQIRNIEKLIIMAKKELKESE